MRELYLKTEASAEGRAEGHKEGLAEGRTEGLTEGREEEKQTIARNALAEGLTPDFVQKITGLSLDEITKL
jgi:predicted transposase/invertase (TIGR01784 family)